MIKIENIETTGWGPAIRGMRNPMNSWEKSDSLLCGAIDCPDLIIGKNDLELMMRLATAGSTHAKYRRMIVAYMDVTAPLYWWKEFDTYKVGTVANSCSTMHKIHAKEFTLDDFSTEHLNEDVIQNPLLPTIQCLNFFRELFIQNHDKDDWWQMIQLLPSSYNQRRTLMLNYEVLSHMYHDRKDHKLDEWRELCQMIRELPYSQLVTLEE